MKESQGKRTALPFYISLEEENPASLAQLMPE
jgi:hypothetical protein